MRFRVCVLVVFVFVALSRVESRKRNPTCPSLLFPNTVRTGCAEPFTRGAKCSYACLPGCVKIQGSRDRTCKTRPARWSGGRGLKCSCKPCSIPVIPNGGAMPGDPCANTSIADAGTTCSFQCDSGYVKVSGKINRTCVDGRWTRSNLVCEPIFQLAKEAFEQQLGEGLSNEIGLSGFWDALDELNNLDPSTVVSGSITDKLTLSPQRWKMVYNEPSGIPISLYTPAFEEFDVDTFFHTSEQTRVARSLGATSSPDVVTEDFREWFDTLPKTLGIAPETDDSPLGFVLPSLGEDYSELFGETVEDCFSLIDLNNVNINDNFRMELFPPTIEYQNDNFSIEAELDIDYDGFNGVELRSFYRNGNLQLGVSATFDENGNFQNAVLGLNLNF